MKKSCSLLINFDKETPTLAIEIKESLEGIAKVEEMRKEVMLLLNGETLFPQLFITIVRYVLPSEFIQFTNCLLLYLEILLIKLKRFTYDDLDLSEIQEIILIIQMNTYRFLCRLNETEIIEPLIPSILQLCQIYKLPQGEQLLVDAPEMNEKALSSEQDKEMHFLCCSLLLQMVVLELIRKVVYFQLLQSQSDNDVKLIVLDRLNDLKTSPREIMVGYDHGCACKPKSRYSEEDNELITPHNIDEVVQALKKEVVKTQSTELEKNGDTVKCFNVASAIDVVHLLNAARVCSCALWIIGEYCLSPSEVEEGDGADTSKPSSNETIILADGTYATQSSASETAISPPTLVQGSLASPGNLRSLILTGDFFLGESEQSIFSSFIMLQLGQSSFPHPIDKDSYDIIVLCIRLLCNTGDEIRKIWLQSFHDSFVKMLADKQFHEAEEIKAKAQIFHAQLDDDLIDFYHLKSRKGMSQLELEDEVQDDLKRASVEFTKDGDDANRLNHILQLTGFSDPVYAEAYVTVHHYDIVLDVTVINRAKETLQNLCLELATMGDLKLVERPQNYTLAPESSKQIRANIKEFLNHIIKSTNLKCLTALSVLDGDCGFLAANLYAKSVFGEDALVNVGIEKQIDGKLSGYIRIRSKTQGISLSSLTIYW
ncbi:hypothetical protein MKW92_044955 [Papaver armeniacum]|nr:hypothetical protein MKW92_044955 [Papaver armeniacum]